MDPQGRGYSEVLKDKPFSYFFLSAPVGKDTVYLGLDFDFWTNCWFYNPSQPRELFS